MVLHIKYNMFRVLVRISLTRIPPILIYFHHTGIYSKVMMMI